MRSYLVIAALIVAISVINTLAFTTTDKKDNGADRTQGAIFDNRLDFFGNGFSDWMVLNAPAGSPVTWHGLRNDNPTTAAGTIFSIQFGGSSTDSIPGFGDYTGDGRAELSLYRSGSQSVFYTQNTADNSFTSMPWGTTDDRSGVNGDYDNDGKMDLTVIRNQNSVARWYILRSGDMTFTSFTFGDFENDIFLPGADYTGDGQDDPAVIRVSASGVITWIVGNTNGQQINQVSWGDFNTDFVVPAGDYNGDGKADFMVWRAFGNNTDGNWYLLDSAGNASATKFGIPGSFAARDTALRSGDYDGDGRTDIAVYRNSNNTFYVRRSSDGQVMSQGWGGANSIPLASFGIF